MGHLFEILIVDDNPADIRIMAEALEGAHVANYLHSVRSADESMAFLRREGAFKDAPRPNLILLDLNMPGKGGKPGKGGLEVLADIKGDPALRGIPTVMLTSSKEESDVARAYDLQANGYIQKPVDLDDFIAVMGGIEQFWTELARVPRMT